MLPLASTDQHQGSNSVPLESMEVSGSSEEIVRSTGQQGSTVSTNDAVAGSEEASFSEPLAIVVHQKAPGGTATVSSSSRPSRGIASSCIPNTCFGSVLNIETLIAEAERDNPTEDPVAKEYKAWELTVWHLSDDSRNTILSRSNLVGLLLTLFTCIVLLSISISKTSGSTRRDLLLSAASYFKSPFVIICLILLWGFSALIFEKNHIPYEHNQLLCLGENRTPHCAFLMFACRMLCAIGVLVTLYCTFYASGLVSLAASLPIILYICGLLYAIYYFWPSRRFVLARLLSFGRIFQAEVPDFVDVFFFDIFTSLSKDYADLTVATCSIVGVWGLHGDWFCGSHSVLALVFSLLPYVVRLIQSIRVYLACEADQENCIGIPYAYLNMMRQFAQVAITVIAWLYYIRPNWWWGKQMLAVGWIALMCFVSGLSLFWDVTLDWRLGVSGWLLKKPNVNTQIFYGSRQWWYYGILGLDIFCRIGWAFRISYFEVQWLSLICTFTEIIRRFIWTLLRIEARRSELGL